jgi:hypothetical protein
MARQQGVVAEVFDLQAELSRVSHREVSHL